MANPTFLQAFYDGYNSTVNETNRADNMYNTLLTEAAFPINIQELAFEIAFLALENPSWPKWRVVGTAYLNIAVDQTHTALDLIGLIPLAGEPADFINGGIYLLEGDGINAAISYAGLIPFAGWVPTGSRLAMKVVKKADGIAEFPLHLKKDSNDFFLYVTKGGIENRGQLRNVMQTPRGQQAHHILPWAKRKNLIIQKATESGKFHMNDTFNGINLDLDIHNVSHFAYDNALQNVLDQMEINYSNKSADFIFGKLEILVGNIRVQLNSGKRLEEVVFTLP